jgi:hypothetical protein
VVIEFINEGDIEAGLIAEFAGQPQPPEAAADDNEFHMIIFRA